MISTVAATIQISIAPVFLLAGIAGILNVLVGRMARVVDRARKLEQLHPVSTGAEHERQVWELRLIDRRLSIINTSIWLCVASAIAICLVVALLFGAEIVHLDIGIVVAAAFIASMLLLTAGLIAFLFEVRLSVQAVHVREELLERDRG
jgi:drug/metabolite transporter (DMT)-like permease